LSANLPVGVQRRASVAFIGASKDRCPRSIGHQDDLDIRGGADPFHEYGPQDGMPAR
jgi:hypothetical protein